MNVQNRPGGAALGTSVPRYGVTIGDNVTVQENTSITLNGAGNVVVENGVVFDYPISITLEDDEWLHIEEGVIQEVKELLDRKQVQTAVDLVLEVYKGYVENGRLDTAFLVRKLMDSFIDNEPDFSNLYKSAQLVKEQIDRYEQTRSEQGKAGPHRAEVRAQLPTVGVVGPNPLAEQIAQYYEGLGAAVYSYGDGRDEADLNKLVEVLKQSQIVFLNTIPQEDEAADDYEKRFYDFVSKASEAHGKLRETGHNDFKVFVIQNIVPLPFGTQSASMTDYVRNALSNFVQPSQLQNFEVLYQPIFLHQDSTWEDLEHEQVIFGTVDGKETKGTHLMRSSVDPDRSRQISVVTARDAELTHSFVMLYLGTRLSRDKA